jgi:uncharacterized membrane protein YgdD (TMEM256/DUF423 family)
MAEEGPSKGERAVSFILNILAFLMLPLWGLATIGVGVADRNGWWIATGAVILAIGVVIFAGSSLVSLLLGGNRPS